MADVNQFDQYRNRLVGLTEQADHYVTELAQDDDFKNYVGKSPEEIRYSLQILKDNVFPIALFAKMQSGKSTTTAAMADGREITPCGKGGGGLRTSTVSVTIYNDDNIQEVEVNGVRTTPVEINLYSNQELVQCILDAVGGNLTNMDSSSYDLTDDEDRAGLKVAVELEIEIYKSAPEKYPIDKLATLREAILILAFYGSDAHQKLLAGELSTITGIQPLLKANEWETKWEKLAQDGFDKTVKKFTAEESLHVFVNNIRVPVRSEFMKRTGTAVTDAPGTMANLRDTKRALETAQAAAIILFLLNGNKEFTEEDKNQLRILRETGMSDKVVFALNFMRSPQSIRNTVEDAIYSVLRQEGYTAPHHQNFLYYNAYLAMHAFQGEKIAQMTLDDLSEQGLLKDAEKFGDEVSNVKDAWKNTTAMILSQVGNMKLAMKVSSATLTADSKVLQEIRAFSRWDEMIFSLRSHILKNRAAGVLLDLGARPVVKTLESIERTLKQREDVSEKARIYIETQHDVAKRILDEFSAEADDVLSSEFSEEIDKALARDYFDKVLLGSVNDAADTAAPRIFDSTGILDNIGNTLDGIATSIGNIFRDKHNKKVHVSIEKQCNNIISNCYKETVSKKATNWSVNLEKSNGTYDRQVRQTVKRVQSELRRIWENLKLENNELLYSIDPIPAKLTGSLQKDQQRYYLKVNGIDTSASAKSAAWNALTYTTSAFGTIGFFAYMVPTLFAIPGFGWILGVGASLVGLITSAIFDDSDERIAAIKEKTASELRNNLSAESFEIQQTIVEGKPPESPGIKAIREFYVDLFKKKIAEQHELLEADYRRAIAELELNQEERDRIKAKAFAWRTEKIAILREDVAVIEQEITKIFGRDGEPENVALSN